MHGLELTDTEISEIQAVRGNPMHRLELTDMEVSEIQGVLNEIAETYRTVEDEDFIHNAPLYAQELPRRVRQFLNDFKLLEPSGASIISGYPIDEAKIGPTPVHWKARVASPPTIHEEALAVLYGSLLGDVFGWSTQQNGYLVHDILPIKGHEQEQMGTGSEQKLWWHTEDAFHTCRGDYIGLLCLRNPDNVATTMASIDDLRIDEKYLKILFEPRFTIRPDESHLNKNRANGLQATNGMAKFLDAAYERIELMNSNPPKRPVLFGDPRSPYMVLDPYFMDLDRLDSESLQALNAFIDAIDESLNGAVLQPGDMCFIDNYRAVHGRNPFKARYDGKDRWLKRVNVSRDLRKSRSFRLSSRSRILY